jgi:hypothetical protein
MSKGTRNRLLFLIGLFTILFALIAVLQYRFVRAELRKNDLADMEGWADELVKLVDFQGKWDLAGLRRSIAEAQSYYVATKDGLLIDMGGMLDGMPAMSTLPPGLIEGTPVNFSSEIGERWRLLEKKVRGGTVILGVAASNSHPGQDAMLKANLSVFGDNLISASGVTDRQVDLTIEYAVLDDRGLLKNASGGIPLTFSNRELPFLHDSGSIVQINDAPYTTLAQPIGAILNPVGYVVVFKDIGLEQDMLRHSLRFNLRVAGVGLTISILLAFFYLRDQRGPAITCEQAIRQDEGQTIEFKSSLRWNLKAARPDKEMEMEVVRTVAAFLNSDGGVLMIGVSDEKEVLGLENDYQTLGRKPNKDGFLVALQQLLSNYFGTEAFARYLRLEFCTVSGKEIAVVYVKPSRDEVFIQERTPSGQEPTFYARRANATRKLNAEEAVGYIRAHWGA